MKIHFAIVAMLLLSGTLIAQDAATGWPRKFTGTDGVAFTVYQPQITTWDGINLSARAAVSATPAGAAAPTFGTVTLSARGLVDNESSTVSLEAVEVAASNFPGMPDQAAEFGQQIASQAPGWGSDLSLKSIQAGLAITQAEGGTGSTVPVLNNVPKIIFSQSPAVLVLVDGDPALRAVEGSEKFLRVINTQALLLLDQSSSTYYLRINNAWASAQALDGPWATAANPPDALSGILAPVAGEKNVQLFAPADGTTPPMPAVYVSTQPAELVITRGAPDFQPVPGTQLLYVTNSGSSIFMNEADQKYYVVISGRWFSAPAMTGPWAFVPQSDLPADMANIPETHPAGTVLASVAGTPQAKEAKISATIPQTATVSRSANLNVNYAGGSPAFVPIDSTPLQYAQNTGTPVIQVDPQTYYAVENGVWFRSASATGPWTVADSVPSVIYTIPPSSPVFYATQVRVYSSDAETVTVGYTPGYFGSYIAPDDVVVFGTGYLYPPFIGDGVWIGPPVTYGFGAGFACGLATGFAFGLAVDHGWGCMPWWGPWHGGWGYDNVNINRNWNNIDVNRQNVYNRWGNNITTNNLRGDWNSSQARTDWQNSQARRDAQNWKADHPDAVNNARNDIQNNRSQYLDRAQGLSDHSQLGDNHVFAGSDGNAYRSREDGGWDQYHADSAGDAWRRADDNGGDVFRGLNTDRSARSFGGFRDAGGFGGGGLRGGFGGGRR